MNTTQRGRLSTPIGVIEVTVSGRGAVVSVSFLDAASAPEEAVAEACAASVGQLREYFGGNRRDFALELEPEGTEFERRVWNELRRIPFGATETYGAIASRLGDLGASRAVGVANARNPIAIIVPCHRVIGSDGDLTGYAGGLDRKRWLLDMESGQTRLDF
jgi:methylated-DNA-[protein]-cysteine S-methyltransferase